jgi:hypothetical protein
MPSRTLNRPEQRDPRATLDRLRCPPSGQTAELPEISARRRGERHVLVAVDPDRLIEPRQREDLTGMLVQAVTEQPDALPVGSYHERHHQPRPELLVYVRPLKFKMIEVVVGVLALAKASINSDSA